MSDFDNFVDNLLSSVKRGVNFAGKKTNEVAGMGKLKYEEKNLKRDITKAYTKLGALVYESKHTEEDLSAVINVTIDEITRLNIELDTNLKAMKDAVDDFKSPVEYSDNADIDVDLSNVEEIRDDVAHKVEDLAQDITDKATEVAADVADKAQDFTKKAADKTAEAAHEVADDVEDLGDDVADEVDEIAEELKNNLSQE